MPDTNCRAQTEPLAALVAVAAIAIGISIYGAYVAGVLPGTSEDAVEEPTIQRVWSEVAEDGVYPSTDNPWNDAGGDDRYDTVAGPLGGLDAETLPRGTTVYIAVSTADDSGHDVILAETIYDESATQLSPGPDEPPEHGRAITRPVPVEVKPGDVRAGTLRVVVW